MITTTNYHNQSVIFKINQIVKFIDDNGQIFRALIVNIQDDLLDLYFEDAENSQGLESPSNCFHA
jgi:hypothetical protein